MHSMGGWMRILGKKTKMVIFLLDARIQKIKIYIQIYFI